MHRVIIGAKLGELVDHVDGNGINNTRQNLRKATNSQNLINRKNLSNTSGYKGVSYDRGHYRNKPWRAQIKINYKSKTLGYFSTPEEAADAYKVASINYFGEFARTN
jgi:hypothetical protein